MKMPRHWIISLLALALPSGVVLLGAKSRPPDQPPTEIVVVPDPPVPGLPPTSDTEAHRGENDAQVEAVRQKIRAALKAPELPALLALSGNDQALSDVTNALSPAQCQKIFQQAMLRGDCWTVANAMMESLVQRKVTGQLKKIARWLMDPSNHFPAPQDARNFTDTAITEWAHSEPRAAADFAARVPLNKDETDDPSSLSHVLTIVCAEWAHNDPVDAQKWAETLPDTDSRKVYALTGTMAVSDEIYPEKAKAWVAQLIGVNEKAPDLTEAVAANLARRELSNAADPQATLQWALSVPDIPARRAALRGILTLWVPNGVDGISHAKQWAASLPPNEARGAAWGSLAIAWQSWGGRLVELAGGSPQFFDQFKINGKAADNWLRSLPAGADRDEAMAIREKFEASILNQRVWR